MNKKHKKIVKFLAIGLPAFIIGWLAAVNFSGVFETGYKLAFLDIRSAIKEAHGDGRGHFFLNGLRFAVDPNPDTLTPTEITVSDSN